MHNWFECKIRYDKTSPDGTVVSVSEAYLVDALSFTEAEARITEEMRPFISGDFQVTNIKRIKVSEMFFNQNGDKWYRSKVNFVTLDEEKGIEKRTGSTMMAQASHIHEALDAVNKGLAGTMADYEIANITETMIMDVYKYKAD